MDEVDRIDVPANDEATNQTEILDVGPRASLAAPVTHHRPVPTPPPACLEVEYAIFEFHKSRVPYTRLPGKLISLLPEVTRLDFQ